jgi:hypothetical protein
LSTVRAAPAVRIKMSRDTSQGFYPGPDEEKPATIRVECYAGHRADVAPVRFFIGQRAIEVSEIIDRWLDPAHSHFKVRGDDDGIYILRYGRDTDTWDMILFDSGTREETRLSST